MTRVEVEIGAQIQEFQTKLAKALKGFDDLKKENKQLADSFKKGEISADKYYKSIANNALKSQKASNSISSYKKSINELEGSMNSSAKSTANGASALTSFSRTIQDAPFGIMGVSNNITNLTEQFGYLKARTGSAQGALKAMLKELKGFGGIALGISVATSLLLVFGDKIFNAKNKTDEFVESLKNVGTSSIIEFKTLTDVILDTTASQKDQNRALEILKDKYSDFDTSLLTTKGNYETAKTAVDNYTASLIQQAKAKAGLSKIEEKFAEIIALEEEKRLKIQKRFGVESIEEAQKVAKEKADAEDNKVRRDRIINNNKFALDNLKDYNSKEISELENQIKRISDIANIKDLILYGNKRKKKGKTEKQVFVQEIEVDVKTPNILEEIDLNAQEWIGDPIFDWGMYFGLNVLDEKATEMKNKLLMLSENVRTIAENNLRGAFASIGQAIGSSLAGAGNLAENLGKALLGAMGSVLTQLGTMALTIGISLKAIKTALKSLNPVAAIGAGVALIALGGYFSSKSSSIGNSIGGSNAQAGGGNTGSSGGGFTGGFSAPSSGGRVVFEIAGRKLVGVLKNEFRAQGNAGTTLSFD